MHKQDKEFMPVYLQLAEDFRKLIGSGKLTPGDLLPSEATLCEQYGVSRMTVRQGLKVLREGGLIESFRGKGSFVSSPRIGEVVFKQPAFPWESGKPQFLDISVVLADPDAVRALRLPLPKSVLRSRRRYCDNSGKPFALETRYYRQMRAFSDEAKQQDPQLFLDAVKQNSGVVARQTRLVLLAATLDKSSSGWLNAPEGLPVLRIEQLVLGGRGAPLGWSVTHCLCEYYRLQSQPCHIF